MKKDATQVGSATWDGSQSCRYAGRTQGLSLGSGRCKKLAAGKK